jgi:hypothetical protein
VERCNCSPEKADKLPQELLGHTSWSAGMMIEEVGGCWSNRFHRFRLCRGCSLVVGRSGRMEGEGVYGVRIVSGVAFLSAILLYIRG